VHDTWGSFNPLEFEFVVRLKIHGCMRHLEAILPVHALFGFYLQTRDPKAGSRILQEHLDNVEEDIQRRSSCWG
jgi:hypothetical protein